MPNSPSHSNGIKKNKWTAFWDSALDWISFIAGGPIHYLWQKDPWLQVAPHIHISYATFPIHSNHVMANVRFSIGVISPRLLLNVYGGVLKWVYPKASSISDRDFQWNKPSMGDPPFMETPYEYIVKALCWLSPIPPIPLGTSGLCSMEANSSPESPGTPGFFLGGYHLCPFMCIYTYIYIYTHTLYTYVCVYMI